MTTEIFTTHDPAFWKHPTTKHHATLDHPAGRLQILLHEGKLCWLSFEETLCIDVPTQKIVAPDIKTLPILLAGTPFECSVWKGLLEIPAGIKVSYQALTEKIGMPTTHVRAVANAIGRNPISLLVPCHRVIRKSGSLGGYRWGLDVKRALLGAESHP